MLTVAVVLCREKMFFFTRKGMSVPELPIDFLLPDAQAIEEEEEDDDDDEEDNVAETAIAINTALVASSNRNKNLSEHHHRSTGGAVSKLTATPTSAINPAPVTTPVPASSNANEAKGEQQRYDYVVDRNYGVEV